MNTQVRAELTCPFTRHCEPSDSNRKRKRKNWRTSSLAACEDFEFDCCARTSRALFHKLTHNCCARTSRALLHKLTHNHLSLQLELAPARPAS
jgi:hypothetical protein